MLGEALSVVEAGLRAPFDSVGEFFHLAGWGALRVVRRALLGTRRTTGQGWPGRTATPGMVAGTAGARA